MKGYVRKDRFNDDKEIKELDELQKEKDQLDVKEIKQPEVAKPIRKPAETWFDGIALTLVNLRESPSNSAYVFDQVVAGSVFRFNSVDVNGFNEVIYKGRHGYISKKYIKKI